MNGRYPQEYCAGAGEVQAMSSPIANNARVCYLGPEGTYTEEAARFFFSSGVFPAKETVPEAIWDVRGGNADSAAIHQGDTQGGAGAH